MINNLNFNNINSSERENAKDILFLLYVLFYDTSLLNPFSVVSENHNNYKVSSEWRELFLYLLKQLKPFIKCLTLSKTLNEFYEIYDQNKINLIVNKNSIIQLLYFIERVDGYIKDHYDLHWFKWNCQECATSIADIINCEKDSQ